MKEKLTVYIYGGKKYGEECKTIVERNGKYAEFYTDGYNGTPADEVIEFLNFLEFDVFEVIVNDYKLLPEKIR